MRAYKILIVQQDNAGMVETSFGLNSKRLTLVVVHTGLDLSLLKPARRYHQWDGKHTSDIRPFTKYVEDEKRRGLILSIIDAFEREIINSGDAADFRVGVNHGDFNDANILLKDDLTALGAIDFGDSVERYVAVFVA